jgi:hypothetical protein
MSSRKKQDENEQFRKADKGNDTPSNGLPNPTPVSRADMVREKKLNSLAKAREALAAKRRTFKESTGKKLNQVEADQIAESANNPHSTHIPKTYSLKDSEQQQVKEETRQAHAEEVKQVQVASSNDVIANTIYSNLVKYHEKQYTDIYAKLDALAENLRPAGIAAPQPEAATRAFTRPTEPVPNRMNEKFMW